MKIAVDAMGGDFAPDVAIEGIAQALAEYPWISKIQAVGHLGKISYYLEKYGIADHPRLELVHADQVVEMGDPSTIALRGKKNSSITVAAQMLKKKETDAIVSAGHTGAAVSATTVLCRTLPGIDRPSIAALLPSQDGRHFILTDAGANSDCTSENLQQFAILGEAYCSFLFDVDKPRIGLMSVGGEDSKGNELTKEAFKMLAEMPINFVGNVEGNSIFEMVSDVVITDGFTGNVILKTSEGLARSTVHWLKDVISKNPVRITSAVLLRNAFRELKAIADSEEFGGAPLLGINGSCIIGHGSSQAKAIKNAIRVAGETIKYDLNGKITQRLRDCNMLPEED